MLRWKYSHFILLPSLRAETAMQATYERSDWIQDTGILYSGSNPHSYNPYQQRDNKKDIVPLETEIPGAGFDLAVAEKCEFRKAKFKVAAFAISTCLVLVPNIIVLGIYGRKGNVGQPITIFSGTCPQSRTLGFWVHFLINVLSTWFSLEALPVCRCCTCCETTSPSAQFLLWIYAFDLYGFLLGLLLCPFTCSTILPSSKQQPRIPSTGLW